MESATRLQRATVGWQLVCEAVLDAMREHAGHDTWPQQLADETLGMFGAADIVKAALFELRDRGEPVEYLPERGGMWRITAP